MPCVTQRAAQRGDTVVDPMGGVGGLSEVGEGEDMSHPTGDPGVERLTGIGFATFGHPPEPSLGPHRGTGGVKQCVGLGDEETLMGGGRDLVG
ncbi:hypothetical protein Sar04_29470 [Salinispora arenicola]|uniref:Uncharacterized protein n=1 Tax=Salinispora arenicola TaxID=168697 RepID=A0ABQ4JTD3_SALAC|nr:hypothetical protein Sar04_29470 [Salinispora arenicola]